MKEILITNDDGYEAEGLRVLAESLRDLGRVTIVSPSTEKSSCGHGLTLTRPLKFIGVADDFYKLDDGTPSDCVYLALHSLYATKPDLVVSGINHGANLGEDATYSGTVAAALEAVLHGVNSIAISQVMTKDKNGIYGCDFSLAAQTINAIAAKILRDDLPLPPRQFLNINVPNIEPKLCEGIRVTRGSWRNYNHNAVRRENPRGEEYFWLGGHPFDFNETQNGDYGAIQENFVSITPLLCDLTAHGSIEILQKWL
ncbi:5'-nucleotidase SurE [Campylobacterota bacterium]|nr:5'-nucleotidase SurE [Campylobacterota bacterium]